MFAQRVPSTDLYHPEGWRFTVHSLEEAELLAQKIADCFAQPEYICLGLWELLINAIEHGNLGVKSQEKSRLLETGSWRQEVQRRLELPENRGKQVRVYYQEFEDYCTFRICDEGTGFQWQRFVAADGTPTERGYYGRGIALACSLSFARVEYRGNGNEVICTVDELPQRAIHRITLESLH